MLDDGAGVRGKEVLHHLLVVVGNELGGRVGAGQLAAHHGAARQIVESVV